MTGLVKTRWCGIQIVNHWNNINKNSFPLGQMKSPLVSGCYCAKQGPGKDLLLCHHISPAVTTNWVFLFVCLSVGSSISTLGLQVPLFSVAALSKALFKSASRFQSQPSKVQAGCVDKGLENLSFVIRRRTRSSGDWLNVYCCFDIVFNVIFIHFMVSAFLRFVLPEIRISIYDLLTYILNV